jgi:hypothetical protein
VTVRIVSLALAIIEEKEQLSESQKSMDEAGAV